MDLLHHTRRLAFVGIVALGWSCQGTGDTDSAEVQAGTTAVNPAADASAPAHASEGEVVGYVIDTSCYLAQGLKGESHRQCAEICANQLGIALNVLDDQGRLWQLVDDDMPGHDQNPTVVQYAEQRVRATGTLIEKGDNRAIIVKDVALLEGTANPAALAASTDPQLGRTFNTTPAANPCASRLEPAPNPCGGRNPCAGQANPCKANPCAPQS
ncbi:MAG: hypothetical protein ACREMD_03270 [Gemmatimonadota bacterium]